MGGPGSGRWPDERPCKETTEDYFALDIREVKRFSLIALGQEEILGVAHIEWVPTGFGGSGGFLRPWFLCPREGCQKRVPILYGDSESGGHPGWACRTCRNLCYPSTYENRVERALRKMRKARVRLGPGDTKPKRMRHETLVRLGIKYLEARKELVEAQQEQLSRLVEQMEQERNKYDL